VTWWQRCLEGRDLRKLDLRELKEHLRRAGNYKQCVSVIKHLYTYLREERGLRTADDPTFGALKTPQSEPAQYVESKADFTSSEFEKLLAWLHEQAQPCTTGAGTRKEFTVSEAAAYLKLSRSTVLAYRARGHIQATSEPRRGQRLTFTRQALDAFVEARARSNACHRVALAHIVLAGTAWHASELVRFSQFGTLSTTLPPTHRIQNGAAAVLVCEHKGAFLHPTAVTTRVADAARDLIALGGVSMDVLYYWTKKAVQATGVGPFAPGQYRHAVLTHAGNQGTEDPALAKFAGHKSETTTKKWYTTRQVPPKIPTFT
jgi:excisionase family DNA binding protein